MSPATESALSALVLRAGACLVAVPLAHVAEVMRPLPVAPLAGAPPFVLGLAIIRGSPVPVVDLAALLADHGVLAPAFNGGTRLVTRPVGEDAGFVFRPPTTGSSHGN